MKNSLSYLLQFGNEQLSVTSDSARLDSEILLAYVLQENRTYLFTWPEKTMTSTQYQYFIDLLERRRRGEPIAYIVGEQEFWSMPLKVTADTLIPRPETELLVELSLEKIPPGTHKKILDLGTGSGAIALAIARERPACSVTGIEQSRQALIVATENAQSLKIKNVHFQHGHWFQPLGNEVNLDMIVSNPPYIALHYPHLSSGYVRFYAATALSCGFGGMDDLSEIAT